MATKIKPTDASQTGGPAYPVTNDCVQWGMTVHDYFLGQALIGILSNPELRNESSTGYAKRAWGAADALVKLREAMRGSQN